MPKDNYLFITHSPYQALLAYSIAAERDGQSHLFVQPYIPEEDFRDLFDLIDKSGIFSTCQMLNIIHDDFGMSEGFVESNSLRINNIKSVRKFIDKNEITEVCGALDDRDITQAAMQYAVEQYTDVICSVIEDGMHAYTCPGLSWTPYWLPRVHKLLYRILLSYEYETVDWCGNHTMNFYGDSKHVSRIYTLYPESLSTNYEKHEQIRVEPEALLSLSDSDLLRSYFVGTGLPIGKLKSIDALLLKPYGNKEKMIISIMREIVDYFDSINVNVGIKHHPREDPADVFQFDYENTVSIPRSIPVELVVLSDHLSMVIGDSSTSLVTSKWLRNELAVISLRQLFIQMGIKEGCDESYRELSKHVGVKYPKNKTEMKKH